MKTDIIRQKYLVFFASQGHKIVSSSSLVPIDDPTLLFTSAGMNQFKKEFLGQVTTFNKAASSQRCLRTGDLDKVGLTSGHHTFFEMLGNFSFGSYFKDEAIQWAMEFLLEELKLSLGDLWVSVYQDDKEAYDIWRKKGFPQDKIVKLGPKDNFWPANAVIDGPCGPCGPCSEIFFDYGKDKGCKNNNCKPGCDCGRFIEIWNLVFTQFNRKDSGVLENLPNKNIDTGMGLERMASVMQKVESNFDTDIFLPITKAVSELSSVSKEKASRLQIRNINTIADHIRAITFAIYDGVIPSNENRGYVIRKLIRKAGFHGNDLGLKEPFLYRLVPAVAATYRNYYPELSQTIETISGLVNSEEKAFALTLSDAPRILASEFKNKYKTIGIGQAAFLVYDTYGIPLEITKLWARANSIEFSSVHEQEFSESMRQQQERSKSSSKINKNVFADSPALSGIGPTEFLGYETLKCASSIIAIIKDDLLLDTAKEADTLWLILDKTPFYGESGGQAGDRGRILAQGRSVFTVLNTLKQGKIIIHEGTIQKGELKNKTNVDCEVDAEFRKGIARAHTATHMLQAALRQVLGQTVKQAGSSVGCDRLRFDFTHSKQLSAKELEKVEDIVLKEILCASRVIVEEMPFDAAAKGGALAFFGEKYDDRVRVVKISDYSQELCGGTHLRFSSEVGYFKIISETSIAKGIRRIEALVGNLAFEKIKSQDKQFLELESLLKTPGGKAAQSVKAKIDELSLLTKEVQRLKLDILRSRCLGLIEAAPFIGGVKVINEFLKDTPISLLRKSLDFIKEKLKGSFSICLSSLEKDNAWIVVGISDDLITKGIDAVKIIKVIAPIIGGDGGGRATAAQAGGAKLNAIDSARKKFQEIIEEKLTKL